ncbi:hypothetical protein E2C01_061574 [Portunus trituberculatus]|uniref:Secreted protein n=1 Tax=Portunus trituberculatus TaxID=210409 RepID=A0A5B7HC07_PORTR|nr:hypothetical protein [Portunus trituberculatus]
MGTPSSPVQNVRGRLCLLCFGYAAATGVPQQDGGSQAPEQPIQGLCVLAGQQRSRHQHQTGRAPSSPERACSALRYPKSLHARSVLRACHPPFLTSHFVYSAGSQSGIRKPSGVHKKISRGT